MTATTLYSVNDVININNDNKDLVIALDQVAVYKSLNDSSVDSLLRIVGGISGDTMRIQNIKSHKTDEDFSYYTPAIAGGILNIGESLDDINVKGKTIDIAENGNESIINLYGCNIMIGEEISTINVKGTNTTIATNNLTNSVTTINGKNVNIAENNKTGTQTNIYGKTVNIAEASSTVIVKGINNTFATTGLNGITTINGSNVTIGEVDVSSIVINGIDTSIGSSGQTSVTSIYGSNFNLAEDNSYVTMKGINANIVTAGQESITKLNGKTITLGENVSGSTATLYSETLNIGDETTTVATNIYGSDMNIIANTKIDITTDIYELNSGSDGAFFKLEKNVTNSKAQIDLGDITNTHTINNSAENININGSATIKLETDNFKINENSLNTYLEVNETNSSITIGGTDLDNATINGSNVYIGKAGGLVTVYGNFVQYSEGSNMNVVTNTVTEETSAFHIHNTGTKTALTVIQDNLVSGGGYNLVEFFTQENQDRTPFRVDEIGRVGMGVLKTEQLKAWLHINRNDPDIGGPDYDDLLLIEDTDSDTTPFIIKKEGDIGIGTDVPKYKLDVWTKGSELNGQGDNIRSKGIALRDVLYIKQNHTNHIFFQLGNQLYPHPVADIATHFYKTGYTFSFDTTNVSYVDDSTVSNINQTTPDGTFTFRMSCKLHIAGDNGSMAYRRFEIFVNPQNAVGFDYPNSSKQMPSHIVSSDTFDTTNDCYDFNLAPKVINIGSNECRLEISWKLNSSHPNSSTINYPTKSRVYLDVEFFGHEGIGDIKASPIHYLNDVSISS